MFESKVDKFDDDILPMPMWKRALVVLAALVALALAGFGAYKAYHAAKAWRAHGLVAEAKDLAAKGAMAEAGEKLVAAANLAPADMDVLRACGHFELGVGHYDCLGYYQTLIDQPGVTRQDYRDAMEACLTFGNMKASADLCQMLMSKDTEAMDYALKGRFLWQERDFKDAIEAMRTAVKMAPEDRKDVVLLAQFLLSAGEAKDKAEAVKMLQELSDGKDAEALRSLALLSTDRDLPEAELKKILDELKNHPLLDDEGRFSAWDLEARLKLRTGEVILKEAGDFYKKLELARRAKAARWIYSEGAPAEALELASLPESWQNEELFKVRLDALTSQKNWALVKKELSDSKAPLSAARIFLYRARVAQEEGDTGERGLDWEKARAAAAQDPDPSIFSYIAAYALEMGLPDEAVKTYTLMAKTPGPQQEDGYESLVKLVALHGTSEELLDDLSKMRANLPSDKVNNDWAFMSLLMNRDVEEAFQTAAALYRAHPELLSYRTTVVLGCIRKNDGPTAAKLYEAVKVDWSQVPLEWRAVHAAALADGGKKAEAEEAALGIDRSKLRLEEREMLNFYVPEKSATPTPAPAPAPTPAPATGSSSGAPDTSAAPGTP